METARAIRTDFQRCPFRLQQGNLLWLESRCFPCGIAVEIATQLTVGALCWGENVGQHTVTVPEKREMSL